MRIRQKGSAVKELFSYNKSYYFLTILIILTISFSTMFVIYKSMLYDFNQTNLKHIHEELDTKTCQLKKLLHTSRHLVLTLAQKKELYRYINLKFDQNLQKHLINTYLTIADVNPMIMQLRYIDAEGKERIRVDKNIEKSIHAYMIPQHKLQNKKHRYYFSETQKLAEEQTWVSEIDLNIENKKIELPYKPTLRISSPVYIKGQFKGIVIVNLHMKEFLEDLRQSANYLIYLIDKEGYFLIHPNAEYDWSKQLHKEYSIFKQFPQFAQNILEKNEYYHENIYAKKLSLDILNDRYTVVMTQTKEAVLYRNSANALYVAVPIFIVIVLLFGIAINALIVRKVRKLNLHMREIIKEQIGEIRHKDIMIERQSRLAIMGEMISMIAHQWRQPLSIISTITANIQLKMDLKKLDEAMIKDYYQTINQQTAYLSQTITDFRDFFKPDKQTEGIDICEEIHNALRLIGKSLESHDIHLTIHCEKGILINTYKGELQQVLINILNNAKDAIVEQRKSGKIIITLKEHPNHIELTICDNGGGVPQEIIEHIMEPYYSTKGSNGTGLGLYMSATILEKHMQGSLHCFNHDEGACFRITLPRHSGTDSDAS